MGSKTWFTYNCGLLSLAVQLNNSQNNNNYYYIICLRICEPNFITVDETLILFSNDLKVRAELQTGGQVSTKLAGQDVPLHFLT
jgi:hypothetical protein